MSLPYKANDTYVVNEQIYPFLAVQNVYCLVRDD